MKTLTSLALAIAALATTMKKENKRQLSQRFQIDVRCVQQVAKRFRRRRRLNTNLQMVLSEC